MDSSELREGYNTWFSNLTDAIEEKLRELIGTDRRGRIDNQKRLKVRKEYRDDVSCNARWVYFYDNEIQLSSDETSVFSLNVLEPHEMLEVVEALENGYYKVVE